MLFLPSLRYQVLCGTALCLLCMSSGAHAVDAVTATSNPKPPTTKPATNAAAPSIVGKHDNSLPIEISSETLEVKQNENIAIFRGNVIAVQGDFRLKSDTMIVHYRQKQDATSGAPATPAPPPAAPKAGAAAAPADNMGSITLIEVEGNVVMATPEESGRGDKGDYHADTRLLHLFGKNVVLTKGKDILRGTALEYNLATGHSVLTHEGGGTESTRVRGVFVPQNAKPADTKSKATLPATPGVTPQPTSSAPSTSSTPPAAPGKSSATQTPIAPTVVVNPGTTSTTAASPFTPPASTTR